MSNNKKQFSYLVRVTINCEKVNFIVSNKKEIPTSIIDEIAKGYITRRINQMYTTYKHYRTQTSEKYFNKTIKQSSYEIENLNDIEIFDLNVRFNKEDSIINKSNDTSGNEFKKITRQSKINDAKNDEFESSIERIVE